MIGRRNTAPLSSQPMSSHRDRHSVDRGRAGRRSAERLIASPVRSLATDASARRPTLGAQAGWNRVSLGDAHCGAVGIADDVGLARPPAGDDPGEQCRGNVAQRRVVMFAGLHQPVVASSGWDRFRSVRRRRCGTGVPSRRSSRARRRGSLDGVPDTRCRCPCAAPMLLLPTPPPGSAADRRSRTGHSPTGIRTHEPVRSPGC